MFLRLERFIWVTTVAGSLVIGAHLCFVFVGYLAE